MSDRWANFERMDKSPACTREEHDGCAHFLTVGGGFNPRRLRLEAGAGLCPCSCHSSCPVGLSGKRMTVPLKAWRESCTCPGAEQVRRRLAEADVDLRDFEERWEERRNRSRARRDAGQAAQQAAQARAAGKGRDEIREIYIAELNARGLTQPSDTILDVTVDSISGKPFPTVRSLVALGKEIRELSRRHSDS
jgi:hypothetical protein